MSTILKYTSAILISVLCIGVLAVTPLSTVFAEPTPTINYQGKLTTPTGIAVTNGTYAMEFKLYTQASGGTAIWTETRTGGNEVTITNGLFSVMLGSVTPLTSVNFNQPLYLGVNIESDGEMTPRKVLGTVPAAFEAKQLGGVASTSFLRSDAVDTASGLLTFTGGLISTASSSIARATFTTATTTTLAINNERFTDLTGTGLVNNSGVLTIATSTLGLLASGDINTSAELAAILTDETGTGALVFATSPTLTGTLTAAAADFSGQVDFAGNTYVNTNGTIRVISGNVSQPSYGFENDTNTGWYNSGDGAIRFSSNATDVFSIISGGNVGIGTTTPSQRFTVGATAGSQLLVSSTGFISDGTWQGDTITDAYLSDTLTIGAGSTFANNIITPNAVLTTGQGDELCLTYESTGSTWEWQACGSGGSSTFLGLTDTPSSFTAYRIPFTNAGATALIDDSGFLFNDSTDTLTIGTATFASNLITFAGAATTTVPNNNPFAFTIATSTSARPLFRVDTTSGGESVSIGTVGGDVFIGGVGSPSDLVFEESSIISGQGTNTITLGVSGDIFNVASGVRFGIATTSPSQEFSVNGDLALTGRIYDSLASPGTNGMVLQTTGSATRWVATSSLGFLTAGNFDTSSELAAILSDETGTAGSVVFSVSPTFTGTPVLPSSFTIGGNTFARSGAFALTLTNTAPTNVTLPTSGTLYGTAASSITSAQMLSSVSDETGTGALVFATSPTLTTPNLGTPSSLTLTNATGLPISGLTGLGSGVATWLATPSSANLRTAITDETGNGGGLVFASEPTFTDTGGVGGGTITLGTSGMTIATDGDGAITFFGLGNGTDENLTLNLDDTADTGVFTSASGLNLLTLSGIGISATTGTFSSTVSLSGTAANIALGSNFLSGDGGDEGIFVSSTGLVSVGDSTPDALFDIDTSLTSGTVFGVAAPGSVVLSGALTGYDMNLRTNFTLANQSVTGIRVQTANTVNTGASTYNQYLADFGTSGASFTQNTGAGTSAWRGVNINTPNITQTTGTVSASGVVVTTGTVTTGGTQNGLNIIGQGVSAGTLNALSIPSITGGSGAENAISVGTGYDRILDTNTVDIMGSGSILGVSAIEIQGDVTLSGTGANILLGSNFLSGDGGDEGISVDASGNVTVSGTLVATGGLTINATTETNIEAAIDTLANLTSASSLATVGTITSGTWSAAFGNNVITPNSILTSGQTDEYCLTYEATGTTFEWQTCSGGGGGANTALSNLAAVAINTSLLPGSDDTIDLGSDTLRFRDLYLGGETLHIGTSLTDEGLISYTTSTNLLNFSTDSTSNGDIAFFGDDLYLDKSTGNVGIGTVGPSYRFTSVTEVANDIAGRFSQGATSGGNYGIYSSATGVGATTNIGGAFEASGATNNYGVLISNVAANASNYALYSTAAAQSSFAGNLGIGTVSPQGRLHVSNGTSGTGIWIDGFTAATNATILNNSNNEIVFRGTGGNTSNGIAYNFVRYDTAASLLTVTNLGRVGVGTSTPLGKFVVNDGTNRNFLVTTDATQQGTNGIAIGAFNDAAAAYVPLSIVSSKTVFNSDVGIGTTTPQGRLSVSGGTAIFDNPGGAIRVLKTAGTFNNGDLGIWNRVGGGGDVFAIADWATGNKGIFIDTNSGNVGIGTTTPGAKLTVAGSAARIQINALSASTGGFEVRATTGANSPYARFDLEGVGSTPYLNIFAGDNLAYRNIILGGPGGNVGIGVTSPNGKLTLSNNVASGYLDAYSEYQLLVYDGGTAADSYGIGITSGTLHFNSNGGYKFDTNGSATSLEINSGGNVGIGMSPTQRLDVNGIIRAGSASATNGNVILLGNYSDGATNVLGAEYSSGGTVLGYGVKPSTSAYGSFLSSTGITIARSAVSLDSEIRFFTGAGQTVAIDGAVTNTEKMRLTNAGNLGIGTASPEARLQVVPDAAYTSINSGQAFVIRNTSLTGANLAMGVSGSYGNVIQSRDGASTAYGLLINPFGGNVMIGAQATPSAKLEIGGTEAADESRLVFAASDASDRFTFETDLDGSPSNDRLGFRGTSADNILTLRGDGKVGVGTASPNGKFEVLTAGTDGVVVYSAGDNSSSIQSYIDGQWADRATYASGCCNTLNINTDAGDIVMGSSGRTVTVNSNPTFNGTSVFATNVGIGDSSPAALLTVGNGDLFQVSSGGAVTAATSLTVTGSRPLTYTSAGTMFIQGDAGGWGNAYSFKGSSGTDRGGFGALGSADTLAEFYIGPSYSSSYMTLESSGEVGIGTDEPGYTLDIRAASPVLQISNGAGAAGSIYLGNSNHGLIRGYNSGANNVGLYTTSGNLYLATTGGSATQFVMDTSGNVGIGDGAPDKFFDVEGNAVFGSGGYVSGAVVDIGSSATDYPASSGWSSTWNANLALHGLDSTSISFHDSGVSVGALSYTNNTFAFDGGGSWGPVSLGINDRTPDYMLDVEGTIGAAGDLTFTNGRKGMVGQYDAAQTQAIFAMGASYVLTPGGASNVYGSFYGLGWSYNPDYGGAGNNPQSKTGLNHQLLVMNNGVTQSAIGTGIWTNGNITGSNSLTLTASNPTIASGGSYINIPYGLYVSGGTPYFETQIQARAGINNDTGTYLTIAGGTADITYINGDTGIGRVDPQKRLDVFETVADSQFRVSYDASNYTDFRTTSGGDLTIDASGGDVNLLDENLFVCSGGSCASTPNGVGTITAERSIVSEEGSLSTSGSITVNWDNGNQQRVGGSAGNMTFDFSNATAGQTLRLVVCYSGTHTITWTPTIRWAGGTAPTPTSTNGKCDVFSFIYTGTEYLGQPSLNF